MARLRQGIRTRYIRAKNKNARYKAKTTKYSYTRTSSRGTTKKFAYTKRITLANGKYRYYYS